MVKNANMQYWKIVYSIYVDTLHAYDERYTRIANSELIKKFVGDAVLGIDKATDNAVLFEAKDATAIFGDIENLSRQDILSKVKDYIESYG